MTNVVKSLNCSWSFVLLLRKSQIRLHEAFANLDVSTLSEKHGYFPFYFMFKKNKYKIIAHTGGLVLNLPAKLLCGGLAGAIAQSFAYPMDVIRRRMQLAQMTPDMERWG